MLAMSQPQSVSQVLHRGASSADPRQLPSQPGLQNQLPLPQLPLRPATPTPASVAAAAVAEAADTTMTDQKDDHHHSDNKSEKDSDSEQSQDGGKRKKSKRRPHKFYCTDFPPCKLSFTRSEHLSRHIRRHTGERPFKCHCNRAFTRLDNLRQHAQTVHANETIPPDSLAAHGGRNRQNMSRGKRASISQHPVNGMPPMGMPSGHSRSLSTPVATYSAQPVYPPPTGYNGAPMQQYHPQHPGMPPNGHPSMGHGPPQNWGPGGPPQAPQQGQYPAGPQFTRPVYGQPMPAHQMSRGPPAPPTGHGHNRSRSLMTPAEISRPGPSSLRDNMNRLRQPSFGGPSGAPPAGLPNGAPANGYSNLPPPPPPPPPSSSSSSSSSSFAPSHRGHNRGQSHSAVIGHSGHSTFGNSFSGPSGHSIRTMNSGPRESRLPQYNLREEMERARSNGSSNNTGNTNSQSPSTPNDDYVQSPITSPIFSTGQDFGNRDYPRERGSISSFDLGRGSISNGDGGDRLAPLPRPAVRETGLPALSLAAYSSHSRSHSWSQTPFNVPHDLRLPPLLLPDNQDMSRPKGPLMEPKPDM